MPLNLALLHCVDGEKPLGLGVHPPKEIVKDSCAHENGESMVE